MPIYRGAVGANELARRLEGLPKQVAFASAKAINDCAVAVQEFELKTQIPSRLTVRSKGVPWTKPGTRFGVNIKPFATKTSQKAVVGSLADWLNLQEKGGVKTVVGHRIAIPTRFWKSDKAILARAKRPRTLISAKQRRAELAGRAFIYKGNKMPAGIYARNERKSRALRMLFRLVDSAPVKAVLEFYKQGSEFISRNYTEKFTKRLAEAISTQKLS